MKIITSTDELRTVFRKCCKEYDELDILVAWVGDPKNQVPFEYLDSLKKIRATVGIDFYQTNPNGLIYLKELKANLRIVESNNNYTFHPKAYRFKKGRKNALIIGSSNLTYLGFGDNVEVNILIEGTESNRDINDVIALIQKFHKAPYSFKFNDVWLKEYQVKYRNRQKTIKRIKKKDASAIDSQFARSSAWISKLEWPQYLKRVKSSLIERRNSDRLSSLTLYRKTFTYPLSLSLFDNKERRKMIWGEDEYAAFGNVGASGKFKGLITNGKEGEKRIIYKALNKLLVLRNPDYTKIENVLMELVNVGHKPTMKVWSRVITILRPDLFCTVSSQDVRRNLSEALDKPNNYFESVEGYVYLLKLIHGSPWFNSPKPANKTEQMIWNYRVALLDVLLY